MMGDNRNNSEDSHIWGFAQADGTFLAGPLKGQKASFTGHAFLIFWPLDRLQHSALTGRHVSAKDATCFRHARHRRFAVGAARRLGADRDGVLSADFAGDGPLDAAARTAG